MGNLSSKRSTLHECQWIFFVSRRVNELLGVITDVGADGKRAKRSNRGIDRDDSNSFIWIGEGIPSL